MTDNPPFHQRGNYCPLDQEVDATELPVTGQVPDALDGLYIRNGPNPQQGSTQHWFVGDGMIHGVRLSNGKADWYRNRWVKTEVFKDPTRRSIGPDGSVDFTVGVNNTSVILHGDRLLTLAESSFPVELDADLNTVGIYDFGGRLDTAMTAHPKICPRSGELLFFGYLFKPPYLTYHVASPTGELTHRQEIPVTGPTMIHDFAVTETRTVFFDLPVVFEIEMAMNRKFPYRWDDGYPARLGVMPRHGTVDQLRWHPIDPCYVFHTVNAYDGPDDEVVIDVVRYPHLWRQDSTSFANDATMWRWTIADAGVDERQIDDRPIEFPRINDTVVGQPHQHSWSVASFGNDNAIAHTDHHTETTTLHDFGPHRIPAEATHVPSPNASDEAEGWLLTYVYDKKRDASDLVILDAASVERDPVAVVELPQRVPFGFHGTHVHNSQLPGASA